MTTNAARTGAGDDLTITPVSLMTPGWVLKRAAIGIAILFVFVSGAALLMHAGIEPETASIPLVQPISLDAGEAVPLHPL